ncbi:MAG TPA: ATP-binding protein, partial [Anaeromyxobacteraceae bacterium]|nr:ATP-binding protein [Anaeromyxobacteraceae bacterium]
YELAAERRSLEERAAILAGSVERSLTEAMQDHRPESMRAIVAAVARTEGVAGVALGGPDGAVRFGAGDVPWHVEPGRAGPEWSGDRLSLSRPIQTRVACMGCHPSAGAQLGTLYVSLDTSGLAPRLLASAGRASGLVLLTLLVCSVGVALVLRRTLVRPLRELRAFAMAIGGGDLSARPPPARAPETAELADALSYMAAELQRSHGELERRVEERTAKLADALAAANAAREARAADLSRLQAIIDSMADGVLFIDAEDRIAMVNESGRVLRNLQTGVGRPVKDCHPKATHAMLDRVLGYLRNGNDAGPAHSIIREREGRFETTYSPVRGSDGAYLGTVMVIRDISERRNLERRLLDAERLSGLGQMSAQVAHELRNPLNAIGGAAQYLRRRLEHDPEVAEYAGIIGDEVQRVNRFVAELLHVARPADPVLAPVNVNRLLREAAQKAAVARGLPPDGVKLALASDLPVIDVDAAMISDALANLLANAFEAGGTEPPEVASTFDQSGGEGTVVVDVRDRGCGIPPDQLEEVLRPFVTTKQAGTGLGLVIVARAVEQHRARFAIVPRLGGGTVATIRFPVRRITSGTGRELA